jgi:molybdenum cofactor cytidylyltransferase
MSAPSSDTPPNDNPRIGCVVLAAGFARRFGADKRQALLSDGSTMLARTLQNAAPAFADRLLILHDGDAALAQQHAPFWNVIIAKDAAFGLGHSLAAALPHLEGYTGIVVALGDMPWVRTLTYRQVKAAINAHTLVLPHYQGQRGNPVGIGSDFFAELATPQGDQGARALFLRHANAILRREVEDPGILRDVDTPQDVA